ncbi:hypothetical protein [Thalassospira marina]|uniref:Lipoprotein n=1 Tax=Thalassospira marina TaxID=2048283 RepID=A0A2N3KRF7_9PROT|nr:hypothetical protein [Thalassospira marina]PKR53121.1 hypothetical protein COO20_15735 [Thalassospira marina]
MMRSLKFAMLGMLTLFVVACTAPIMQVESQPFPDETQNLSMDQLQDAIIKAASSREWTVKKLSTGKLMATYARRDHLAKVEIDFSQQEFSILYVDSTNLKYNGGTIHKNYNRWVNNLKVDIQREVAAKIAATS